MLDEVLSLVIRSRRGFDFVSRLHVDHHGR